MSFHPYKCTVIRIATNQRHVIPTQYTLHGHTIEVVDSAKYLGVTISEDLQWSKHIHNAVSKANRTMGFNRRNLRDCTKPVKAAAYTTMARPTFEYASTVWVPHSSAETHKLEQVQRRAASLCRQQLHGAHTWPFHVYLGLYPSIFISAIVVSDIETDPFLHLYFSSALSVSEFL